MDPHTLAEKVRAYDIPGLCPLCLKAENTELKQELEWWHSLVRDNDIGKPGPNRPSLKAYFEELQSENATLKKALGDYGRHRLGCNGPYGYPCKCGWEEAKKLAEE